MQKFSYSEQGLALTEGFEGLRLTAYQDVVGVWTIGYGHTGPDVTPGLTITQEQAEALLRADVGTAVGCVNGMVTATITQSQFDALVDFCFNLGCRSLFHSTLLRDVNAGDFAGAVAQFGLWVHAGGVVENGLVRRRASEAALFASSLPPATAV
jgi:lysozyme